MGKIKCIYQIVIKKLKKEQMDIRQSFT